MLDFRYLSAFLAVAEDKSFTQAGTRLRVATSAISRQIRLLEEACGHQLVFRSPQDVQLTPIGEALSAAARHFKMVADEALQENIELNLRIGVLEAVLQIWLLPILKKEIFPKGSKFDIRIGKPDELMELLSSNTVDAIFYSSVYGDEIPSAYERYDLFKEKIVLASKAKVELGRIAEHPWICFSSNTWIMRFTKKRPKKIITVNSMRAVVELVREGVGIAMLPSYMIASTDRLQIVPVSKFSRASICLVTRKFEVQPRRLKTLLDAIRQNSSDWKQIQ